MSRVGAFFDLDRTLVACNTGRLFLKDLRNRGEISLGRALRALGWLARYHFSLLDVDAMADKIMGGMRGWSEQDFETRCQRWVEDQVLPLLLPAGLRKIEEHRRQGHLLAILSTSPSYVTRPIARTLGMDEVLSTQLEVEGGLFTGRVIAPACFGPGKVHWAEQLGRTHKIDLGRSWFYTDSFTDVPMLERVGHQVVVNPDPRLRRAARQRGWPVENWLEAAA
jgi:HAD superfamily hydrolase (TIGR01490 family)